ncbi:MAG: hypothetical protein HQK56_17190 [Deltaproteobacteria bacterium]|nr:hypothetical protein [Deltaproteobacteria bacterium]
MDRLLEGRNEAAVSGVDDGPDDRLDGAEIQAVATGDEDELELDDLPLGGPDSPDDDELKLEWAKAKLREDELHVGVVEQVMEALERRGGPGYLEGLDDKSFVRLLDKVISRSGLAKGQVAEAVKVIIYKDRNGNRKDNQ